MIALFKIVAKSAELSLCAKHNAQNCHIQNNYAMLSTLAAAAAAAATHAIRNLVFLSLQVVVVHKCVHCQTQRSTERVELMIVADMRLIYAAHPLSGMLCSHHPTTPCRMSPTHLIVMLQLLQCLSSQRSINRK